MAAEKGSAFLLKKGTDSYAMCRSTGIAINGEIVDITNKGSSGFRELLAGAGTRSVSISASGVFTDASYETDLIDYALDGSSNAFKIVDELGSDFSGNFVVTSYEQTGEYNGETTFSITLESNGTVTRTEHV